jgi:1,4-alpha-glucan branching enzyme
MLTPKQADSIIQGRCNDPFALLGPHAAADGSRFVRAFLPGASTVHAVAGSKAWPLAPFQAEGLFEGTVADSGPYQLRVRWAIGGESLLEDPYRFGTVLGDMDVWLLGEGSHLRPYEILGATPRTLEGVPGTSLPFGHPTPAA